MNLVEFDLLVDRVMLRELVESWSLWKSELMRLVAGNIELVNDVEFLEMLHDVFGSEKLEFEVAFVKIFCYVASLERITPKIVNLLCLYSRRTFPTEVPPEIVIIDLLAWFVPSEEAKNRCKAFCLANLESPRLALVLAALPISSQELDDLETRTLALTRPRELYIYSELIRTISFVSPENALNLLLRFVRKEYEKTNKIVTFFLGNRLEEPFTSRFFRTVRILPLASRLFDDWQLQNAVERVTRDSRASDERTLCMMTFLARTNSITFGFAEFVVKECRFKEFSAAVLSKCAIKNEKLVELTVTAFMEWVGENDWDQEMYERRADEFVRVFPVNRDNVLVVLRLLREVKVGDGGKVVKFVYVLLQECYRRIEMNPYLEMGQT
jgi:hypothetical protein